jgi:hypothetical protein
VPSNVALCPSDRMRIENALQDCVRPDDSDSLPRNQSRQNLKPQRPRPLIRANTEPTFQGVPYLHPKTDLPSPSGWPDRPPPPPPNKTLERRRASVSQSENLVNRPLPSIPDTHKSRFSVTSDSSDDSRRSYGADSGTTSYDADHSSRDGPFMVSFRWKWTLHADHATSSRSITIEVGEKIL